MATVVPALPFSGTQLRQALVSLSSDVESIDGDITTAITTHAASDDHDDRYVQPSQIMGGFKNKIINGNFNFWQRDTSFTAVGYTADRWRMDRVGASCTTARQAFALGQTVVPNNPRYFVSNTVTSATNAANFARIEQRIESVTTFAGETATLSFWAKADASKSLSVEFIQSFGTGGSPSATVTGIEVEKVSLTTSWQKFTITVEIPSISGKTLGSDNNDYLAVSFWFDAGTDFSARTDTLGHQSGTFDIASVQLESGATATPFEQRFIGTELAMCQRYYESYYGILLSSGQAASAYANTGSWKATKRANPVITTVPESGTGSTVVGGVESWWQGVFHSTLTGSVINADAEL